MIGVIVVAVAFGLIVGLAALYNDREQQRVEREATSAATGRECGGSSVGVSNPTQPVIGSPRGGCNSPARASRHLSEVGTFKGVPIFAYGRFPEDGDHD